MNAITLARVSSDEQKDAHRSLPAQEERVTRYRESHGFDPDRYFEIDESAYKDARTRFDEVLTYLERHSAPCVALVVDKVDRLTRNAASEHLQRIEGLRKRGKVEFHFVTDNLIYTQASSAQLRFMFYNGVNLAQYYSDSIRDSVERVYQQKIRRGELLGHAKFGYRNVRLNEHQTTVLLDPVKAPIVRTVYDWYLTGAYSMETIAKKVTAELGVKITLSMVDRILEDKFYHGVTVYKKRGVEAAHSYETLVTRAMWELAQTLKHGRNRKLAHDNPRPHQGRVALYRSLIHCATCGCAITGEFHRHHFFYRCTQYRGRHGSQYVAEEKFTDIFSALFRRLEVPTPLVQEASADLLRAEHDSTQALLARREYLRDESIRLEGAFKRLLTARIDDGSISAEDYEMKRRDLHTRQAENRRAMANVETDASARAQVGVELLKLLSQAEQLFRCSELDARRSFIALTILNVTWDGEKLHYEWKKPFNVVEKMAEHPAWGRWRESFLGCEFSPEILGVFVKTFRPLFDDLSRDKAA